MKTLRLYILKELTAPVVLSTLFFTLVLLLAQLLQLASTLLKAGVSGSLLGQLVLIVTGTLMTFTVPMGVLLGTLIAVGRLTGENEVLAMRVGGISVLRAFTPVVVAAFLLSCAHIAANNSVVPNLFSQVREITYQMQFHVLTNLKPGRVYDELGTKGTALALTYGEQGEPSATPPQPDAPARLDMNDVSLRMRVRESEVLPTDGTAPAARSGDFEFLIFSESGAITGDPATAELTLDLEDGTWMPLPHSSTESPNSTTTVIRFEHLRNRIGSKRIERAAGKSPREMTIGELRAWMQSPPDVPVWKDDRHGRRIDNRWQRYFSARNVLISRFSLPLATLTFCLIAIPLAMEIRPQAKAFSALIAIGLLIVYYLLMTAGNTVGASGAGWITTIGAHMLPNIAIGTVGLVMFLRVSRH